MALSRNQRVQQPTVRQAIFLGATEPRAARPERVSVGGGCNRVTGGGTCQRLATLHRDFNLIAAGPTRAVASHHEGEWRCTPPRSKEGRAPPACGVRLAVCQTIERMEV